MNEEMLTRLRNAESAEEIVSIAKEYGREVTAEQAQELLDRLKVGGGLGGRTVRRSAGNCRWREYHRFCRGLVEPPLALMIRRAAPTQGAAMWFAPCFTVVCFL